MNYDETKTTARNESMIPNTQIESMFLRICDDEQMHKYTDLVEKGHISLATAYASNLVYKVFYLLIDQSEKNGVTVEDLMKNRKGKT